MSKLKELEEKKASIFGKMEEFRNAHDGKETTTEERAAFDKMLDDFDEVDKRIEAEKRYLAIEKESAERQETVDKKTGASDEEARSTMIQVMRYGLQSLPKEKREAISGVNGSAIMPTFISDKIEVALKSIGPMLNEISELTTEKGGDLKVPTINDTTSKATLVEEYGESTKKEKTVNAITLKAYTFRTGIIPISMELIQDASFNIEQLFINLMGQQFSRGINEYYTTGTGTSQPKGIVTAANAVNAAATTISLDDLLDLMGGVDAGYDANAKFMFNKNTMLALMKIKDQNKNYILTNGINGWSPMVFGKPFILNSDMADIAAESKPVVYGDLSKYLNRKVKGITYSILRERLAEYNSIGLIGYCRCDGNLIDAGTNPVAALKMAAATPGQ